MSGGKITSDPLFLGLTRPTLIFGVSIQFAMINMMLSLMIFIQTSSFIIIPIAFVMHGVGYILCFKEPRFVELYLNKVQNFNVCYNKNYYGANSYMV